jgi:hypothetical protein
MGIVISGNKNLKFIKSVYYQPVQPNGEGGTSNLISFTIDGVSYQAEEGMTWEDWVNSEYNVDKFWCDGNYCVRPANSWMYAILNAKFIIIKPSDVICDGCVYRTGSIGGGGNN